MPELREDIKSALQSLISQPLREASLALLSTLGYRSDRTLVLEGSKPQAFLELIESQGGATKFDSEKACFADWKSADILFQLTDEDLADSSSLFKETDIKRGLLRSYLFFAIELKGVDHSRSKLSAIARQINRVFPMPVMVLLKHDRCLSIAVINRRQNKIHADKDVLEKVTLIRDISLIAPHRGHLEILQSIAFAELEHPKKLPIRDFDTLHAAWEQIFNIELLNNRFYKELSNWYFWALDQVDFPDDLEKDAEKRRATGLIRMLTRLIFCWFLKEKDGLIPSKLFDKEELEKILHGFDPESETSSTYYQAILQNLFFATLNQRMGKDSKGNPYRYFATDEGFQKNRATYDINNLYRYENLFAVSQEDAIALFADIPFLNGGLFECLDRTEDGTNKKLYLDGFSRRKEKRPHVPDRLFFDSGETADLSAAYGDKKRKSEKVTGLISILNRYKFTIVENTPIDQEIALDPELLGKVFENLLASYNEETKTTARKQTGSFYTPRPIVDYMVDESLKAHLERALTTESTENTEQENQNSSSVKSVKSVVKKSPPSDLSPSVLSVSSVVKNSSSDVRQKLDHLFTYTEDVPDFSEQEKATLITAIDEVKILDPACGSGAFPMGVLHKLVYILGKLDEKNEKWEQIRIDEAQKISDADERRRRISEIMTNFADNNDDYGRKLYLIENCLYGVDIQPIAIQITKLRFFISLVCDQKTNRNKKENHGIRPLPNLETKFVAADTLIGLPEMTQSLLVDPRVGLIEKEIESLYHSHFSEQRRDKKLANQRKVKSLRQELGKLLAESLMAPKKAQHLAEWDPFDPQSSAEFFDPHWMFGRSLTEGFDIVLGNPPYLASYSRESVGMTEARKEFFAATYTSTSGRINTFILFTERSCALVRKLGHVSFIVPKPFLMMTTYQKTRRMLATLSLKKVIDCREEVFTGACVPTCIFLFQQKQAPENHAFDILEYGQEGLRFRRSFPNAQALSDSESRINVTASEAAQEILQNISKIPTCLNDFCFVEDGINPGPFREWLVTAEKVSEKCVKLIEGRNFHRYLPITWAGKWFLWDKHAIKVRQKDIPNSIAVLGDESRFLADRKIVTRQTADGIIATLDKDQYFSTNSVHTTRLRPEASVDLNFILGVLNSGLIRFFFKNQFKEKENAFPQVKVNKLRKIPIPRVSPQAESVLSKLVACILVAKAEEPTSNIATFLEDLIDACVMECYFCEHMAERDLLFHDTVAPYLAAYDTTANEAQLREFLINLHATLNAPSHPMRQRLDRIVKDSPDLLAVIKQEGKA